MIELEICNNCNKKATTFACFECNIFKLKGCIEKLNSFIKDIIDFNKYIFYFNQDYYYHICNAINLDKIPDNNVRITPMLENNQVCVIIDKNKLDWGDIYLKEFKGE